MGASEPPGIDEQLARELARVLEPLVDAAEQGPEGFLAMLEDAGLEDVVSEADREKLRRVVEDGVRPVAGVLEEVFDDDEEMPSLSAVTGAIDDVYGAIKDLDELTFEGLDDAGERLLDYLLIRYLDEFHHRLYSVLNLFGVIVPPEDVGPKRLDLEAIPSLLQDPGEIPKAAFGWGDDVGGFLVFALLYYLKEFFWTLGLPASLVGPDVDEVATLAGVSGLEGPEDLEALPDGFQYELRVPVLSVVDSSGNVVTGFKLVPLPGETDRLPGLALVTFGSLAASETLSFGEGWTFNVRSTGELGQRGFAVQPTKAGEVDVRTVDLGAGDTPDVFETSAELTRSSGEDEETVLLGRPGASRIAITSLSARVTLRYRTGEGLVVKVEVPTTGLLGIHPSDFDGFLAKVMPPDGIFYDYAVAVGWSSEAGLFLEAGGTFSVSLPQHERLGPALLREIHLALEPATGAAETALDDADVHFVNAASLDVELGPITATVRRIGLSADVAFREDADGNLGPLDLEFGFQPPSGAGVDIDAPAISGGGYLEFDRPNERYAGVLQLQIGDISISAIGLLTTRLPDGGSGFSLLVLITGEFTPIQLGLGFTLNGLGGLLGINRSFKTDPLRQAVRTGSLDSVLFPENPVANAQRIVSDLRSIFPPTRSVHVFGPLARLGYGTPTLVTLDLGIVVEFPTLKIAILGRIDAGLPTEDAPVIELHMDVVGVLDPPGQRASIDARLYDSRVAAFSVSGEMAMRTDWGDRPRFVLSIGGFHPRFTPPEDVGELERARVALGNPSGNPSLDLTGYFAITSNTAQVGAHLKLRAEAGPVSARGHLGFDALFQFDPFEFVVDFIAALEVRVFGASLGISIEGTLSGPEPYRAQGRIKISLFLVTVKANLDVRIGSEGPAQPLPKAQILPELTAALSAPSNWTAQRPAGGESLVTLRSIEPEESGLLAHPLGRLGVRQTVVPLEERIETFGNARPASHDRFTIDDVTTGSGASGGTPGTEDLTLTPDTVARENFAPAQFYELTDSEKLDSPAFERKPAGRQVDNGLVYVGADSTEALATNARTTVLDYEESVIDKRKLNFLVPIWELGAYTDIADTSGHRLSIAPHLAASFAEIGAAADETAFAGIDLEAGVAGGPQGPRPTDAGPTIDPATGLLNGELRVGEPEFVLVTADEGTELDASDAVGDGYGEVAEGGVYASKTTAQRHLSQLRDAAPAEAEGVHIVERWRARRPAEGESRTVEEAFGGVRL